MMKKLQLAPEHLRVESFPVQDMASDYADALHALPTGLPQTCPECPYTRNVVCYTVGGAC